jgi:hypothetical protein
MQGDFAPFYRKLPLRLTALVLTLIALVPVAFILTRVASAARDIAYWDEFDTALSLLLQLDSGVGFGDLVARLFAVSNEHRMVTSRLMFAVSYWLTGTVDFAVVSWIGNASLVALCVLLVVAVKTPVRRLRLGFVLAMLLFQLEHYENFLWSGSSIDHFQVVLLAGAAVIGLAAHTRTGLLVGALCALLATFTLAHGMVVWPAGALMLWQTRRLAHLKVWCLVGACAAAGFLAGFQLNTAQRFVEPSWAGAWVVAHYWLATLGSVPALGHTGWAPWLGLVLLAALAEIGRRGAVRRESIAFPLACYAVAALALIAAGRAAESGGVVHSRYFVLSALAWALVVFMWLDRVSHPRRPLALLWGCVPVLAAFNIAADQLFTAPTDTWLECRDRAAVRFKQYGVDGRGPFTLHPAPEHATQLLHIAEQRGVYRMGPVCDPVDFPADAQPSSRIKYFVEEVVVDGRAAAVAGWATIPGLPSERGQVHLVLRSGEETHLFTTVTVTRPDVAAALKDPECALSGFRFARLRDGMPTGEFQIGFLIEHDDGDEFIMTEHRLRLVGEGKALLATAD